MTTVLGEEGARAAAVVLPDDVPPLEPVVFDCGGDYLVGCVHHARADRSTARDATGVVIIVGGPQYRAGSHRQYVHLARTLAAAGWPVLRFDVRGMGDSSGAQRNLMHITADIGAAVDELQRRAPGVERVVLWGLCGGASAALLYLHDRADRRISGLCLANPWVRTGQTEARTQLRHYYGARLRQREFWQKLLRGGVGLKAVRDLAGSVSRARQPEPARDGDYRDRMLSAWKAFGGPTLVLLSAEDYTAREFADYVDEHPGWRARAARSDVQRTTLEGADHTCSSAALRADLERATLDWLASCER
jgi:exosortase A-associated hydrolase 1